MMLSSRTLEPELMDDPALPEEELDRVLRDLHRLNRLSLTARSIAKAVQLLCGTSQHYPLRLLDVGCGSGETFCDVINILLREGIDVRGVGVDANPMSVERANEIASMSGLPVRFKTGDGVQATSSESYHIAISSLFLHHLTNEKISEIFAGLALKASIGTVMCDLERRATGYILAQIATRILSRSPVVHHDGPQSVRASLTRGELKELAVSSGLHEAQIKRVFPCQMLLTWKRIT